MLINETAEPCPQRHLFHMPGARQCASCIVQWMRARPLSAVEDAVHLSGVLPAAALDGYRHAWAMSAVRSAAYDHWRALPDSADGRTFARLLAAPQ